MTEATFQPCDDGLLRIDPLDATKALTAARLAMDHLGFDAGGQVTLHSSIRSGAGMGSSSADVVATIRAIASATGQDLAVEEVAAMAVKAETASDPLMVYGNAVLFAHRDGSVVERFAAPLPPILVVGVDTDPHGAISTVEFPPAEYDQGHLDRFDHLRGELRQAIVDADTAAIGAVATASAHINEQYLPKPGFATMCDIAETVGAVGVQVAHSGTVAGVMLDARCGPTSSLEVRTLLQEAGFEPTETFMVGVA